MNRSTPRSQMHLSNQQSVTHSPSAATDSTQISEKAGPVPTSSHDSTSETHTTAVPSATPIGKAGSQTPSTPVPAIQPPKRVAGSYPTRTSAGEAPTSQQTSRTVSEGGKSLSSSSTSNFTFRKTSPSGSSGLFGGGVSSSGFGKPSLFGISSPAPGTTATTTPSGSLGLFGGGISCSGMDKPSSGSLFGGFGTPSSASGTTAAQKPFKWSSSESSLPRPGASPNEGTKPFTQSDILEEKNSDGRSSSKVSASNPRIENS
ncbi:hypothetical protein BCR34DRAFT_198904 [Clohesyomyces aquaticus]|uniref:Uncharacterized protein n=1 Tax=Clohesyomyces aquaticus TaxID=1231657 RepID=A0A1Y1ZY12_9PLEO|nr:hypothetical protein BCR34DRAFT_198904 [Clohesyomyces aquaticus]